MLFQAHPRRPRFKVTGATEPIVAAETHTGVPPAVAVPPAPSPPRPSRPSCRANTSPPPRRPRLRERLAGVHAAHELPSHPPTPSPCICSLERQVDAANTRVRLPDDHARMHSWRPDRAPSPARQVRRLHVAPPSGRVRGGHYE